MSRSKRRKEGYLLIDHRYSEGVPDAISKQGNCPSTPAGYTLESATITCCHCNRVVILNPNRTRERGYCAKCDHYVCDNPACNKDCTPFAKIIDDMQNAAVNALAPSFVPLQIFSTKSE